jgi:RecJ-like exonuclease
MIGNGVSVPLPRGSSPTVKEGFVTKRSIIERLPNCLGAVARLLRRASLPKRSIIERLPNDREWRLRPVASGQ